MTAFQPASQATHSLESLERPESFTVLSIHTFQESGKAPIAGIAELALRIGRCTNPIDRTHGRFAGLILKFSQFRPACL